MKALFVIAVLIGVVAAAGTASAKVCPAIYQPVCAVNADGKRSTYSNACVARAASATIFHPGKCIGGTVCMEVVKTVCAIDPASGKKHDYSNLCFAELANARWLYNGRCRK